MILQQQTLNEYFELIIDGVQDVYKTKLDGILGLSSDFPVVIEPELFDIEVRLLLGHIKITTLNAMQLKNLRIRLFGRHAFIANRNLKIDGAFIVVGELDKKLEFNDQGVLIEYTDLIVDEKGFFENVDLGNQMSTQELQVFKRSFVPNVPALNGPILEPPAKKT